MSSDNILSNIKLCIESGKASPKPPVGSALGQYGVNIMNFCKEFNDKTSTFPTGSMVNVKLTVFKDKKFKIISMKINTSYSIKKIANVTKCSSNPGREIVCSITRAQVEEIAKEQLEHLNAYNIDQAVKIISGSARSMGIEVKEV